MTRHIYKYVHVLISLVPFFLKGLLCAADALCSLSCRETFLLLLSFFLNNNFLQVDIALYHAQKTVHLLPFETRNSIGVSEFFFKEGRRQTGRQTFTYKNPDRSFFIRSMISFIFF